MYHILFKQSYIGLAYFSSILLSLLFGYITYQLIVESPTILKKSTHKVRSFFIQLCIITAFTSLTVTNIKSFLDTNQTEINLKENITTYYQPVKDEALLHLKRKKSAPTYFSDQVTVKIISENDTSYQVQYKDVFDRIPKTKGQKS